MDMVVKVKVTKSNNVFSTYRESTKSECWTQQGGKEASTKISISEHWKLYMNASNDPALGFKSHLSSIMLGDTGIQVNCCLEMKASKWTITWMHLNGLSPGFNNIQVACCLDKKTSEWYVAWIQRHSSNPLPGYKNIQAAWRLDIEASERLVA